MELLIIIIIASAIGGLGLALWWLAAAIRRGGR